MNYFQKLPNFVREAPGLECAVMKKLPLNLWLGTLFPLVMSLANRFFPRLFCGDDDKGSRLCR